MSIKYASLKAILLEWKKLHHRRLPLLFFLALMAIILWTVWCSEDLNRNTTNDPFVSLYINLLLMNTILIPIILAAAASRMCDIEQLGNTYPWICTIQEPKHIYFGKAAIGTIYLAVFCLLQVLFITMFMYKKFGIIPQHKLNLYANLFLSSLCIFLFQLNLSLGSSNQLTPVFISIGGTFTGLFAWFLNQWPLRYLIPWGYYAALCNAGFSYNRETRYTTCYWNSYPVFWLFILIIVIIFLYQQGCRSFLRSIRKTM